MSFSLQYLQLIIPLAILVLAVFIVRFAFTLNDFIQEYKYVNMEIARATKEGKRFWKKKRLRLYLSLIPFVRSKND